MNKENPVTVLLVEDGDLDSELMQKYLEKLGCAVIKVKTGVDALKLLRKEEYHFIISDINLEGMVDGLELLRLTREFRENMKIPFLLVTGERVNAAMEQKVKDWGGVAIYEKWDAVIEEVRIFVQDFQRKHEAKSPAEIARRGLSALLDNFVRLVRI